LPKIYREFPNHKYFVVSRMESQHRYLEKRFELIDTRNIVVTRYIPRMQDCMFFSAIVMSGGGTIVRESALMNVPSIQFFPGETAPQDKFLMENGFPLQHIKDPDLVAERAIEILSRSNSEQDRTNFKERLRGYENPLDKCHDEIVRRTR